MSRSVGKRIQIFQIVRDLLLFVAHRDRDIPVSVRLGRRDDIGFVEMEFGGEGICFECPPDWGYDLLGAALPGRGRTRCGAG